MTCNKCEHCAKEKDLAPFELAMHRAGEAIAYILEHDNHPQYDRIKYPNRVAVDQYFMGIHKDEFAGPRLYIYNGDTPADDPMVYISSTAMGLIDNDATPPMLNSTLMVDLVTKFKDLLENHFFQG